MRVVIAGDFPDDPSKIVGGIQAVIYNTLLGLVKYPDLEIQIVSCEKWGKAAESGAWIYHGTNWMAHHLPSPKRLPHTISILTTDRYKVARTIRLLNPDLIHAHGQVATYPWAAFDIQIPTVITVHGINALEARIDPRGGTLRGRLRALIWEKIERACLRRANDLILISPFVAKYVKPFTKANLHWIENPVQDQLFQLVRQPNPGRVLYIGSIQKRKGLADLINAIALLNGRIPNIHLRVAGAFMQPYEEYGNYVKQLVYKLNLEENVHFLGHLNRASLMKELQTCEVFCLPSYLEASPVVVAEAMAASCPVVTTAIESTEHLILDGETGVRYPPGDIYALVEILAWLMANKSEQNRISQNAREVAIQRFSPDRTAEATYKLYQTINLKNR